MARTAADGIKDTIQLSVRLEAASLPYLKRLGADNVSLALRRATRDHLTASRIMNNAGTTDAQKLDALRVLILRRPHDEQPTNQEETTDGQPIAG